MHVIYARDYLPVGFQPSVVPPLAAEHAAPSSAAVKAPTATAAGNSAAALQARTAREQQDQDEEGDSLDQLKREIEAEVRG